MIRQLKKFSLLLPYSTVRRLQLPRPNQLLQNGWALHKEEVAMEKDNYFFLETDTIIFSVCSLLHYRY